MPAADFLNGTAVFFDLENIYLYTKISIVCHLEAEILIEMGFYMEAILKIQYGRHKYCEKSGKIVFRYGSS